MIIHVLLKMSTRKSIFISGDEEATNTMFLLTFDRIRIHQILIYWAISFYTVAILCVERSA